MATSTRECHCPWCIHSEVLDKVRETKLGSLKVQSRVFKVLLLIFLLLSGSFITFPVVSAVSVRSSVEAPSLIESPEEGHSQTLSPGPETDCLVGQGPECTCTAVSKCKKCSRFETSKQVQECLFSGYKQYVYCPNSNSKKKQKYISCQFSSNSSDEAHFWIFEILVGFLGILSFAVVRFRISVLQRQLTKKIQRQLNA